ncbi:hypothetical protein [Rariglobus hedericola]|uniref:Uncharacterized protein n=1 Tax=Rariglobus hedericola TaxID=2597822 RepID=A0A556QKG7_9BACT|nr:hypothetical protein [Rariglobus hedericola]TSJ77128.1 hypothetical protein FPL22_13580 [Rariglobus hedericola]
MIERKDSALGDKRAPIDLKEKRDKTIVDRKDYPKPEVRDRELNSHDGQRSSIQPKGDQILKYDTVAKYQDRMKDAETAASQRQPKMEKRTTFDKLNRFLFKRNGPGTENGTAMVTPAAGGPAPASQDTHTNYNIDWSNTSAAPR